MRRVLVVSPHPDDAEVGCGGMIHKMLKLGYHVTIAICAGEGDLNMVHSRDVVSFERRMKEQVRAAGVLGALHLLWLHLAPASKFDTVPQAAFVSAFDKVFGNFDEVYLPLPSYNDDHTRVWNAGVAAFRPEKLDGVNLYAYEQPFSNCLPHVHASQFGKRYIELSREDVEAKEAALRCHESQMVSLEHSIYGPAGSYALARLRGLEAGCEYAELVYVVRERVKLIAQEKGK